MDVTLKGIKVKLYPTCQQKNYMDKLFGCYRFVYNKSLEFAMEYYKENEKTAGLKVLGNFFHQNLTKNSDYKFLKEHNTKVLKQAIIDLLGAYKNFFVNGDGFPNFKSKHNKQSARFPIDTIAKNTFTDNGRVNLTKQLHGLKFRCSKRDQIYLLENPTKIKSFTISKDKVGDYWGSFLIEFEPDILPESNSLIGIDLGVKELAVLSNGEVISNPKWYHTQEKKIKRLHREHGRKLNGSNNREKARVKLTRAYRKITNQRQTTLHQISSKIINDNQVIVLENLNVAGMLENHNSAKAVQNVGLGTLKEQLKYKAEWYDRDLVEIDRWFPSSKLCSNCGSKKDNLNLSDRIYKCTECGFIEDRDYNAALNIEAEGFRIAQETLPWCGHVALASGRSTEINMVENGHKLYSGGGIDGLIPEEILAPETQQYPFI